MPDNKGAKIALKLYIFSDWFSTKTGNGDAYEFVLGHHYKVK
jgi:hypothetical protein